MRRLAAALSLVLLATCAGAWAGDKLDASVPQATIVFLKPHVPDGGPWGHGYAGYYVEACGLARKAAVTAGFVFSSSKTYQARAGQPFVIQANSIRGGAPVYTVQGPLTDPKTCVSAASFTPEAGHGYEVTHLVRSGICSVRILDKATGEAPASVSYAPVPARCAG